MHKRRSNVSSGLDGRGSREEAPALEPLTRVIVSHHHFDHSVGFRTAVAEGMTIVADRRNPALFEEMVSRPGREALGRTPRRLKLLLVDD